MNEQLEEYFMDLIKKYGEKEVLKALETMQKRHKVKSDAKNKYQLFRMYLANLRKETNKSNQEQFGMVDGRPTLKIKGRI